MKKGKFLTIIGILICVLLTFLVFQYFIAISITIILIVIFLLVFLLAKKTLAKRLPMIYLIITLLLLFLMELSMFQSQSENVSSIKGYEDQLKERDREINELRLEIEELKVSE